ncbi:MAG TPA: amino acid adenylation domain-containing protein [Pyrinomonadaceae bacterium]|nr:amino acid adenylation domain-containing protein [Pyrinomonadaceae bacterium]
MSTIWATTTQDQRIGYWNDTRADFPEHLCGHELFEAQVEKSPTAPAVLFDQEQLTYQELNERANQLAHYLRSQGYGPEKVVGICLEGSLELPIAVLGVIKSGAAYLPLDPDYPQNRLAFMIGDAGIDLIITHERILEKINYLGIRCLFTIDSDEQQALLRKQPTENPALVTSPRNACYVIYTSGSTGRPKGVVIEHRGLVNLMSFLPRMLGLGPGRRVLQFASFSFDQSVEELFEALVSGATLCLAKRDQMFPGYPLLTVLKDMHITDATLGPSVLAHLPDAELPELQTVIAGGEALPANIVDRWARGRSFFNAYGPTETTWGSSAEKCEVGGGRPNIGGPFANVNYYVVNEGLELSPVGEVGELLIGGAGVGRGYLARPDLSADRFIPDPFSGEEGARLYRTGDLVKWLEDGKVDYVGRVDHQVKLRGFRIELGEIEAVLSENPDIAASVVVLYGEQDAQKELVVYLVSRSENLNAEDLQRFMAARLPDYMVPRLYVFLTHLPLTPSGKVDPKALPSPEIARRRKEYVAPRTPVEEVITGLFVEVLQTDRVGVQDDLFGLGASSLQATMVSTLIQDSFKIQVPLAVVFDHPTVEQLAAVVEATLSNQAAQLDATASEEDNNGDGAALTNRAGLVSLRKGGAGAGHLYFIHDLSGQSTPMVQISKLLTADVNVWGIEANSNGDDEILKHSIKEMAADYIEKIRATNTAGVRYVGGWSFGGAVAYEIARQLAAGGEPVGFVAAIDADSLDGGKWHDLTVQLLNNLRNEFPQASSAVAPIEDRSVECQSLLNRISRYRNPLDDLKTATPEYIRQAIMGWDEIDQERLIKTLKKVVSYAAALASYVPGERIDVTVEDFRATIGDTSMVADRWESFVSGPVRLHQLDGNHRTILSTPIAATIAARLSEALEQPRSETASAGAD